MKPLIPSFLVFASIVALVILDQTMGWGAALYLLRKLSALIEYVSFWR